MKTMCFCVGCKKHPLHEQRDEFDWLNGWRPGRIIYEEEYKKQGIDVDCLEPGGSIFDFLSKEDYEFPITAYGDGMAITGFSNGSMIATAYCKNEEHEN